MIEIMIHLQQDLKAALYEQIYEYIKQEIADGNISMGEKLPSTRLLAKNLSVSRSTVELAYEQLLSEGYLESRPGSGYYACDIGEIYQVQKEEKIEVRIPKQHDYIYDFSPYMVDLRYFPYNVWKKITRMVISEEDELFKAGNSSGEDNLKEEVAKYLHQARGVKCNKDQIIIGSGNDYLLLLLAQILGIKKRVVMENPTYIQAYRTFCNMDYSVYGAKMDKDGISLADIKKVQPDIVYTMPSHQYPLGIVMPLKRRMELLSWANEDSRRYIIEDDHDSEFRYKGKPIPSLQGYDTSGKVIYLGTFSKSIAPAIRIGYMVLPKEMLKQYYENCGFYSATVSKMQQEILFRFMEGGYFERHLNRMRGIYKAKHDYFFSLIKNQPWVKRIYGDNAGLHLLVEIESKKKKEEIDALAKEHSIKLYFLSDNYIKEDVLNIFQAKETKSKEELTLILGYGKMSEEELEKGIELLGNILEKTV